MKWFSPHVPALVITLFGGITTDVCAGSATNVTGLYYTGQSSSGTLQPGGGRDANWDVTYAFVGGTRYRNESTYTSDSGAYVLSSFANSGGTANYIDPAYVPNTGSAQWITAPGAMTQSTGGAANTGGDFLPGNGTTGTNSAFYVYQLGFNIVGTGNGVATNQISINLTIAADDAYSIYVSRNEVTVDALGNISSQYAASASGTTAWSNTRSVNLQNFGTTLQNNATFNIGLNYLTIVVRNTNSQTGTNTNTALNPSGLLMYQVGATAMIDGSPVPEVGVWLPLLGAVGLYGGLSWKRGRSRKDALAIA